MNEAQYDQDATSQNLCFKVRYPSSCFLILEDLKYVLFGVYVNTHQKLVLISKLPNFCLAFNDLPEACFSNPLYHYEVKLLCDL